MLSLREQRLFTTPPRLVTLNLNGNRLTALPASFARLGQLVTLGLGANRIASLPADLSGLIDGMLRMEASRRPSVDAAIQRAQLLLERPKPHKDKAPKDHAGRRQQSDWL